MPDEQTPGDSKADPNGAGGSTSPGDTAAGAKRRVTFNDEQQAALEHHGDQMFGKGFQKAEAIYEGKLATMATDLSTAKAALAQATQAADKGKADGDKGDKGKGGQADREAEVARLQALVEELQGTLTTLKTEKAASDERVKKAEEVERSTAIRQQFLKNTPKGVEWIDVDEVLQLCQKDYALALTGHGTVMVMNPRTGLPRPGADGDPMTLAAFVAEVVAKKPYFVKSKASPGSGSGEARELAQDAPTKAIDDYTDEEFDALTRRVKSGQAVAPA
jgi:hypothetical protein